MTASAPNPPRFTAPQVQPQASTAPHVQPSAVRFPPDGLAPVPDDGRAPVPLVVLRDNIQQAVQQWRIERPRAMSAVWTVHKDGRLIPWTPDMPPANRAVAPPPVGYAFAFRATKSEPPCTGLDPQPRRLDPGVGIAAQVVVPGAKPAREWGVMVVFGLPAHKAALAAAGSRARPSVRVGLPFRHGTAAWRFAAALLDRLSAHLRSKAGTDSDAVHVAESIDLLARSLASCREAPFRWVYL
jgi:hypothetical protein